MEDKKAMEIAIAAIMMRLISAVIAPVSAQMENRIGEYEDLHEGYEFADEFFEITENFMMRYKK